MSLTPGEPFTTWIDRKQLHGCWSASLTNIATDPRRLNIGARWEDPDHPPARSDRLVRACCKWGGGPYVYRRRWGMRYGPLQNSRRHAFSRQACTAILTARGAGDWMQASQGERPWLPLRGKRDVVPVPGWCVARCNEPRSRNAASRQIRPGIANLEGRIDD